MLAPYYREKKSGISNITKCSIYRRQLEREEYAELNETAMIDASKLHVEMPTSNDSRKEEASHRDGSSGGRYTTFPGEYTYQF